MTVVRIWQGTDKIYWVYRRSAVIREAPYQQRAITVTTRKP